uniref:Amino acid transporter n=1 Tax=Xiphophorus couchianus TaxID=32473 RepID=A0A3B5KZV7_9TELE
ETKQWRRVSINFSSIFCCVTRRGLAVKHVCLGTGFLLRFMIFLREDQLNWLRIPGDMLLNVLQMFAVPLIVTSVLAVCIVLLLLISCLRFCVAGLFLVLTIRPGAGEHLTQESSKGIPTFSIHVILMDLLRQEDRHLDTISAFVHIVTFLKYWSKYVQNDTEMKLVGSYVDGPNMLGLIVWSFTFGILINRVGQVATSTVKAIQSLNDAIKIIFNWILWYLPIGVLFLIVENVVTIVSSRLAIQSLLILPMVYFTDTFPVSSYERCTNKGCVFCQSTASLPVILQCCEENLMVNGKLCRLMLPILTSLNMNGTAVYEVIASVFIAQMNDITLDAGQIIAIGLTSSIVTFGAAGIPASGAVTTILILTAVGLPARDAAMLVVVEWVLDHVRTGVNVIGDCYGVVLINFLCHDELKDLDKPPR